MTTLHSLLFPQKGKPNLQPISIALSGKPTERMRLHEPVYVAAVLQQYWLEEYCEPEDGPPSHDDFHQAAFADWIELFGGRYWRGMEFVQVQVLGYHCSEVENTVPPEWFEADSGWDEGARTAEWWLEAIPAMEGCLFRLCTYAEGGFDLQFWFYCTYMEDA